MLPRAVLTLLSQIVKYKGEWMTDKKRGVLEPIDQKKFQLMSLPPEVRYEVLRYLPDTNHVAVFLPGGYDMAPIKIRLPRITQAGDKLLRQEAIKVVIETATFAIHSGPGNDKSQAWLGFVDLKLASPNYRSGFDAVRSLDFPYFSRYPLAILPADNPNHDIELMRRCGNLEVVAMEWVGEAFVDSSAPSRPAKSVGQLCREYRLDRMLVLQEITTLRLIRRRVDTVGETAFQALAAWFRTSLPGQNGSAVQVVVE